eukprot:107001-Hanusia_phi.AAC.2
MQHIQLYKCEIASSENILTCRERPPLCDLALGTTDSCQCIIAAVDDKAPDTNQHQSDRLLLIPKSAMKSPNQLFACRLDCSISPAENRWSNRDCPAYTSQ